MDHQQEPLSDLYGDDADIAQRVEQTLLRLRKCGTPSTRRDWSVVLSVLIICTDAALLEFAKQSRIMGLAWLEPVVNGILNELSNGTAERDATGAVRLKPGRRDPYLHKILNG